MHIAVFCPNWVGDAVMATPVLRVLREYFRDATISGVLKPYVAGVLEGSPWFDRPFVLASTGPWKHRWPAIAARLRRERIDLAILLANTFRSALVAWLAGCRRRVGYTLHGRGCLLTDRLTHVRDARGRRIPSPEIDAYNRIIERIGCPTPSHRMQLFTTASDESQADAVWRDEGFDHQREVICLNPGGAFGSAKHWPTPYFAQLARELADRRGSTVLVLCGPSERDTARQIVQAADRPLVHALAEYPLSIGLTKACVRRADLLITTDSGPRHFAAAFDRPVVTLFGPTHIAWTETYYARAVHLQKRVPCGPCQMRVCPLDHRCMNELSVEEVYGAAEALLRRYPPAPRELVRQVG